MLNRKTHGAGRRVPAHAVVALLAGALFGWSLERECRASPKEECLEAHSRGQDLRDRGQLTEAQQTFMSCAQSSCPALIQADCARFGEELQRLVPSVSFAARDGKGADLPDTEVFVDETRVAMRLDEGKSYDVNPGRHLIRFVHQGRDTTQTIVLNQGEKARNVVAAFSGPKDVSSKLEAAAAPQPRRPMLPLAVAGVGGAAAVTGAVLVAVGLHQVPSNCSLSSRQCTATPGDPSFGAARQGVSLANVGIGVGLGGATMLVGGLVWYFLQPPRLPTEGAHLEAVQPWIGYGSGGVAMSARF